MSAASASGAAKRKRRKETKSRNAEEDSKYPKISSFITIQRRYDGDCEERDEDLEMPQLEIPTAAFQNLHTPPPPQEDLIPEAALTPGPIPTHSEVHDQECDMLPPSPTENTSSALFDAGVVPECIRVAASSKYPTDIAHFKNNDNLSALEKKFIVTRGPCQPVGPFLNRSGRSFCSSWYQVQSKSGFKIRRTWLCYSPTLHCSYCLPCWLFCHPKDREEWVNGFFDFQHMTRAVDRHENSGAHAQACLAFARFKENSSVDAFLEAQIAEETSYWAKVLERIIDVILTLCMNDLALRGHRNNLLDPSECKGNFLEVIHLLAKYDPILKELLQKPDGTTKYLSPQIQNEIISEISNSIKNGILQEVKNAPFFSYIADSTTDTSHVSQLSSIYRYVTIEYKNGGDGTEDTPIAVKINESFIGFEEEKGQTAEEMYRHVNEQFTKNGLDISRLRGLGFDGASNMSGHEGGLQALIRRDQPLAVYVNCPSHKVNLALNDSVKGVLELSIFYDNMQRLYIFFSASSNRWEKLKKGSRLHILLKKLCPTRWTSRCDCLKAIRSCYGVVMQALDDISHTSKEPKVQAEAKGLKTYPTTSFLL